MVVCGWRRRREKKLHAPAHTVITKVFGHSLFLVCESIINVYSSHLFTLYLTYLPLLIFGASSSVIFSLSREVKRIHETRRVRVRPTSLVKHSWRVEKRLSHWWRVADECDVKKNGAWTPSRIRKQTACNCKSAESRSWSYKVCFVLWVHCDFDLMSFLEREVKEQEDGVVVGVGSPLAEQPLPLISTEKVHAVAKSTLSKVQIPRCRKGQSPTTLSEVDVVQNPTLPKKKV